MIFHVGVPQNAQCANGLSLIIKERKISGERWLLNFYKNNHPSINKEGPIHNLYGIFFIIYIF
jgi:hypothetical protein